MDRVLEWRSIIRAGNTDALEQEVERVLTEIQQQEATVSDPESMRAFEAVMTNAASTLFVGDKIGMDRIATKKAEFAQLMLRAETGRCEARVFSIIEQYTSDPLENLTTLQGALPNDRSLMVASPSTQADQIMAAMLATKTSVLANIGTLTLSSTPTPSAYTPAEVLKDHIETIEQRMLTMLADPGTEALIAKAWFQNAVARLKAVVVGSALLADGVTASEQVSADDGQEHYTSIDCVMRYVATVDDFDSLDVQDLDTKKHTEWKAAFSILRAPCTLR